MTFKILQLSFVGTELVALSYFNTDNSGNVGSTKTPTRGTLPPRCPGNCDPIAKPIVDSSAIVYVILGLKAIDRSKIIRESVFTEKVLYKLLAIKDKNNYRTLLDNYQYITFL